MPYYFKVKIGFDKNDFISIDESELAMAIKAQTTGMIAVFKNSSVGTVAGNNIISVLPDWSRELGYKRGWIVDDEDFIKIGKKRIAEYRDLFLKETKKIGLGGSDTKLLDSKKP